MNRSPGLGALLGSRAFLRLWVVGALSNSMRQFEVLAVALFTLQVTHSDFAVAAITAARSMPMLLLGALAGCVAEAWSRRAILIGAQFTSGMASAAIALLALAGIARPWQVAIAAIVSGIVWSTEMATRRRMIGESVPPELTARALALDSVTGSLARMAGPLIAGVLYQYAGLLGCFGLSSVCYVLAGSVALGVRHPQIIQRLRLMRVPGDLTEALFFARRNPVITGVLGVTIAMNVFGFCYTALVAPLGAEHFHLDPALIGVLAAAEPAGALIGGLALTANEPPVSGRLLMAGGSALFCCVEAALPVSPWFGLGCFLLFLGGFGTASFSNMQTALILKQAPGTIRSRLMGLLTVCIGSGPLGLLAIGALAAHFGNAAALQTMGLIGVALITAVAVNWRAKERRFAS